MAYGTAFRHKCSDKIKQADTKAGRLIEKQIWVQLGWRIQEGKNGTKQETNEEISCFEELNVLC
jgi:hypothetical protein